MVKNWFFQGLVTNLAWAIVAAIGATMLAVLRAHGSTWASPALYWLVVFVLIMILGLVLRAFKYFSAYGGAWITPTNAQTAIRDIFDKEGLGVKRMELDSANIFGFAVTLAAGTKLLVHQTVASPQYLQIKTFLTFDDRQQGIISNLPNNGAQSLLREMRMRLAASKIGYSGVTLPLRTIGLTKTVPIIGGLTEFSLFQAMNEVELALGLLSDTVSIPLETPREEPVMAEVRQISQ
jgi:hypothetical protein